MDMRQALIEAKEKLREQQELIEQLSTPPFELATVLGVSATSAFIALKGSVMEVPAALSVIPGQTVRLNEAGGVVGTVDEPLTIGEVRSVRSVHGNYCELDSGDGTKWATSGIKLEPGDRVIVDNTESVVIKNLGKIDQEYAFNDVTNVSWDDVGGLSFAKQQMVEAVEHPHKYPDIYKKYNKSAPKGVLLYGPPGCGKTMLAKATATALAKLHGESASSGFIYIKGPEILNMYVGESEAKIRRLFKSAREHYKRHGYPAVIFIDEADAVLGRRGGRRTSGIESTTVPMFLAEMDGLDESGAMVLLATNMPNTLDPAVVRDGRVDRKIEITRPNQEEAKDILAVHMKDIPLAGKTKFEDIAEHTLQLMFTDDAVVSMMSGALIAGVVDFATSSAISRDISNGKFGGVTKDDMANAVAQTRQHNSKTMLQSFV